MPGPAVTVVVPAFNEEGSLRACVEEQRAKLAALGVAHEILVVDDGSRDGTWALAEQLAREHAGVRALRHDRNRGMAAAVRTGLREARGEWVIPIPGDNQFDVDLARVLDAARDADVVVGVREGGYATAARRFPSWLYSTAMRVAFGLRARGEVNLYRRALIDGIETRSDGFFGNTELLIRAVRRGARVAAVPVRIRPRAAGVATGRSPRRIAQAMWETIKLRWRLTWEG